MNGFYEKHREEDKSISFQQRNSLSYSMHFHINLEVLLLLRGETTLTTGGENFLVRAGDIAVVDSYEMHAYKDKENSDIEAYVLIFPYSYLRRFSAKRKGKGIAYPVVRDEELCQELAFLAGKYLSVQDEDVKEASADLFLNLLYKRLSFTDAKTRGENALVREILIYVQENFRTNISRRSIAHALGYTEAHISRVFHKGIGKGISEYINGLRLAYIDRLRAEGDNRSTIELLYEAGFNSQQTYYRVRKVANGK